MRLEGEFQYTYARLRRVTAATMPRGRGMRIGGLIGAALSILLLVVDDDIETSQVFTLAAFVCVAAAPELLALACWMTQRRTFAAPFRYTVTETGAEIRSSNTTVRVGWTGLTWIRVLPDVWLLRNGAATIAIPRAAFNPEDQAATDAFLAGAIGSGVIRTR